ncbi:MAG TPA: GMC family oxidoreductase [Pseudomonadales bacterium]|nr:GMC family oxidoreductase [Pseudomonadales bacterium]
MAWGLVIQEKMTGWIAFDAEAIQHPFQIKLRAFTRKIFSFQTVREFRGEVSFPGYHLPVPAWGSLTLTPSGPIYHIEFELEKFGLIKIDGRKHYRLTQLQHSLTTLTASVTAQDKKIGAAELVYRDPIWSFPFTALKLCRAEAAFGPFELRAELLSPLLDIIADNWREIADEKEVMQSLAFQLQHTPPIVRALIESSTYLFHAWSWISFYKPLSALSAQQKRQLTLTLEKAEWAHLALTPLLTLLLSAVYGSTGYRQSQQQHIPQPPRQSEPERWMAQNITPTVQLAKQEHDVDVVVVGSGAGGAPLAYELARRGYAVAIVEQGRYFKRTEFTGNRVEMMAKLYRDGGLSLAISNAGLWLPTGISVGGTTTINSGTAMRTPDSTVMRWREQLKLEIDLTRYFPAVEHMLDVKSAPEKLLGGVSRIIARGADQFGYAHHALPRAETGCDGQGYCILGCPIDAKRSTNVSYIPAALQANAFLFSNYRVDEILFEQDKAVGVRASLPGYGPEFSLQLRAKAVVIAAGSLNTPALLKPYVSSPHLGKHLTIHPTINLGAWFNEPVRGKFFVPQSYGVFHLPDSAFSLEGYTLNADTIPLAFSFFGDTLKQIAARSNQFTNFAAMLNDQIEGDLIFLPNGRAIPRYLLDANTVKEMQKAAVKLAELFFAAGAERVYAPVRSHQQLQPTDLPALRSATLRPSDLRCSAYHPLGTARMGGTRGLSVCQPDGQVWGKQNLYVSDGAAISGPLGVNPQVTIMANALRVADEITAKL